MPKSDNALLPLQTACPVELLQREMVEKPLEVLHNAEGQNSLGIPGFHRSALPLIAARLKRGRAEAQAIADLLDLNKRYRPMLGALRVHLEQNPPSAECVIWLLFENRVLSASEAARRAAQSKNAAPREFVADEWATRADRGQSKASFARMVAPLVKQRFDVIVSPDRIARYWLPRE